VWADRAERDAALAAVEAWHGEAPEARDDQPEP